MKKVLITGGSGYIGSRLCLHLADQGYEVTPLCHFKLPKNTTWVSKMDKVIIGDVRDEDFLIELAKNNYDVLIHLVSLDHYQSNGSPIDVSATNITPVWSLLEIFSKHGLKKFLYFSTAQVYGILKDEVITELSKKEPQNSYGLTHHLGESICEYYNRISSIDCRVIRLSNSYGSPTFNKNNCWWLVINDLCSMAYRQKEIVLQSDGAPLRDFIHGWDVCDAVQLIIETSKEHTIYNLSSGSTISIMEIAHKIKAVFLNRYGIELSIKSAKSVSSVTSKKYVLDNSLIRSIGFEVKWSLEDGINELFDFLELKNE